MSTRNCKVKKPLSYALDGRTLVDFDKDDEAEIREGNIAGLVAAGYIADPGESPHEKRRQASRAKKAQDAKGAPENKDDGPAPENKDDDASGDEATE